jgi:hypothetical protein
MMRLNLPTIAVLAALVGAAPLGAQHGNGHGRGHDRDRDRDRRETVDRRHDRDDDDVRWERRRSDDRAASRSGRRVPPGWCRGVGNPHRTVANCGYNTDRIYRDRSGTWRDRNGDVLRRDGIYRDRNGVLRDRYGRVIGSRTTTTRRSAGSWSSSHDLVHRQLRACNASAEGAGIRDRIRRMNQCSANHDAWHRANPR